MKTLASILPLAIMTTNSMATISKKSCTTFALENLNSVEQVGQTQCDISYLISDDVWDNGRARLTCISKRGREVALVNLEDSGKNLVDFGQGLELAHFAKLGFTKSLPFGSDSYWKDAGKFIFNLFGVSSFKLSNTIQNNNSISIYFPTYTKTQISTDRLAFSGDNLELYELTILKFTDGSCS